MNNQVQNNPILADEVLPRLDLFRPEHVTPALDHLLEKAQSIICQVIQTEQATWASTVAPIDQVVDDLSTAWEQISHLHAVVNTPELNEVYNANIGKVTAFYTELGQNEALYAQYKKILHSPDFLYLNDAQRRVIHNTIRDFRLTGAELNSLDKKRFKAIYEELASLSAIFSQNVLNATDDYQLYIEDKNQLTGLPEDVLQMLASLAANDKRTGYKITLQMPSYIPIMQYAENRQLREQLYYAYVTRASEIGPSAQDNSPIIERILQLRKEAATLLGFDHYAALSLATKMAKHVEEIYLFLETLAQYAKPYAKKERAELEAFAKAELGLDTVEAWDIPYATAQLQQARYAFSDQQVKQYFTEPKVLAGLFSLIKTLYGMTIRPASAPVWHASVQFFHVYNQIDQHIGSIYLDNYARLHKRSGAWMASAKTRYRKPDGTLQLPVAYITCNFTAPIGDDAALLSHDDVLTLFHEFGHGLHHILTQVDAVAVSGINGVEWDAVELPSQFMENFCWEWEMLQHLSSHVTTHEPLPRVLFEKMLAAKHFQTGMMNVRQIEFALFDLLIHHQPIYSSAAIAKTLDQVRQKVAVNIPPAYQRFAHTFSHIFSGGYAAGYYSYKWAELLSADAYSYFEEKGIMDREVGSRFLREILEKGGSRPALESFIAFRGRPPVIDALLNHNGIAPDISVTV